MAKTSGIGWNLLSIDDSGGVARDIRNDITNFQFSTPRGVQDVTGVDKSAKEALLLLADLSVTLSVVYNPAANRAHSVFRTVPSTSVARTTAIGLGVTPTLESITSEVLYTDYQLTRAADGSLTASVPGVLADGTVPAWVTS